MLKGINRGFSMVELLVAMGLFAVVGLFASQLYKQISTTNKDAFVRSDMEASNSILNNLLGKDLLASSPSFNYLSLVGIKEPDTVDPVKTYPACKSFVFFDIANKEDQCALRYEMSLKVNSELVFLVTNDGHEDRQDQLLVPSSVFDGVTFNKVLMSEYLVAKILAVENYFLKAESADSQSSMLLVTKKVGSNFELEKVYNKVNHDKPAAGGLSITAFDYAEAVINCNGSPTYKPDDFQMFLKCLPGTPGSLFAYMRPIRIIRYKVVASRKYEQPKDNEKNGKYFEIMTLLRASGILDNGELVFRENVISNAISRLVFKREDTSSPLIQFEATIEKASYTKNLKRRK